MDNPTTGIYTLFLDHRDALIRTLWRLVDCRHTAEDLAQEAYLRVMAAAESGPITYPSAFLYQTARNLALDHLRREKVRGRSQHADAEEEAIAQAPDPAPTPEHIAARQQEVDRLFQAMAGLSERRRQILILYRFHGWPYERIAAHLGISRSAVEKNVHVAMAHLLAAMDGDEA